MHHKPPARRLGHRSSAAQPLDQGLHDIQPQPAAVRRLLGRREALQQRLNVRNRLGHGVSKSELNRTGRGPLSRDGWLTNPIG